MKLGMHADALKKWAFLHLNAAKLFSISSIFKAGARSHKFNSSVPNYTSRLTTSEQ